MITPMKHIAVGLTGLVLVAAASLKATPVTVQEVGIGPNQVVSITSSLLGGPVSVYAGVVKLKVDGTAMNGFCIDPWHWSVSSPLAYDLRPLAQAPAWPAPMGSTAALEIERLWDNYYTPGISGVTAAALQIEIWKIVDTAEPAASFTLVSAPASVTTMMGVMETWLGGDLSGSPAAWLSAVVSTQYTRDTKVGQDYVIPGVPEGGWTVTLVGIGLLGLLLIRRSRKNA